MPLVFSHWYHIPTVILSWLSFFCSLYVCISAYMLHVLHKKEMMHLRNVFKNNYSHSLVSMSHPLSVLEKKPIHKHYWETEALISHHIFWMAFCDTMFAFWAILTWTPQLFDTFIFSKPSYLCTISAVWVTASACAGTLWYLVIAYCLFCIIFSIQNKCSDIANKRTKAYHSIFVWLLTVTLCLIVGVLNGYGYTTNIHDTECGTLIKTTQIIIYTVYIVTVSFAICLFCAIVYKLYIKPCLVSFYYCLCCDDEEENSNTEKKGNYAMLVNAKQFDSNSDILTGLSVKKQELVLRLTEFTIVFIIVWMFPIWDRIHRWISDNDTSPEWLAILHNWFLVSIGLGNAIVWMRSKSFQSFYESKKLMTKIDERIQHFHRTNLKSIASPDTICFKKRMFL